MDYGDYHTLCVHARITVLTLVTGDVCLHRRDSTSFGSALHN